MRYECRLAEHDHCRDCNSALKIGSSTSFTLKKRCPRSHRMIPRPAHEPACIEHILFAMCDMKFVRQPSSTNQDLGLQLSCLGEDAPLGCAGEVCLTHDGAVVHAPLRVQLH